MFACDVSLQVDHVQVVEQLRTEVDSLKQQLQHAQSQHMELTHMPSKALAPTQLQGLQQHQEVHCVQELVAMQQLTGLVLQQLQLYHSMQQEQQLRPPGSNSEELSLPQMHVQQQRGQVVRGACDVHQQQPQNNSSSMLVECQRLKQQLQQVSEAADALLQGAAAGGGCSMRHVQPDQHTAGGCCGVEQLTPELQDPLAANEADLVGPCGAYGSAMQQLRQAMQGPAGDSHRQQGLHNMDLRLHNVLHLNSSSTSRGGSSETQQQLRVAKLRMAYQQMLHNVQARYQEDLRQLEVRHSEVSVGTCMLTMQAVGLQPQI
jgi:hypothetical protein